MEAISVMSPFSINDSKIGSVVPVIIEGYDEEEFCYVGRCSFDTPDVDGMAFVYSEDELNAGDIIYMEIIDFSEYSFNNFNVNFNLLIKF